MLSFRGRKKTTQICCRIVFAYTTHSGIPEYLPHKLFHAFCSFYSAAFADLLDHGHYIWNRDFTDRQIPNHWENILFHAGKALLLVFFIEGFLFLFEPMAGYSLKSILSLMCITEFLGFLFTGGVFASNL